MPKDQVSLFKMLSFAGKTVLITGAGSGIGREIALRFAEAGADLILLDINPASLEKIKKIVLDYPCSCTVYQVDLSSQEAIEVFWKELDKPPDILVNNAGIYPMKDFLKVTDEFLQRTLQINMLSVFWMCQQFIKQRIKKGGVIVNISSIEALLPFKEGMGPYGMSKAGVISLTRSLARDYGKRGFRVNCLLPGAIKTKGTRSIVWETLWKFRFPLIKTGWDFQQRLALGRWGEPDEVAKVVVFLSSDLASYIQGVLLPVDGGFLSA